MDVVLSSLIIGSLALAFDRQIANAMNQFSIGVEQLLPQFRWHGALPSWSRERFENFLWWVRLCGTACGAQRAAD